MVRPSDWYLVGLDGDPVPGDAFGVREVARIYSEIAYVAADAASLVRGMRASGSSEGWVGDAGDVFRSQTDRMPGELSRADDSYSVVADALTAWASALEDAQAQADRGLALARDAHADLVSSQTAYDHAHSSWSVAHAQQLSQQSLQKQYRDVPPPSGVSVPTDAQLRASTRNAAQAQGSMDAAAAQVASATARLEAAKRLVMEAKASRDVAEATAVKAIGQAKGQAVKPSSIWEAIQDSAAWQAIVVIATVVLTIVSIVAIFVGGPIVWAIIAAATVLLMVNALLSIAQGKNAWLELGLLAIGLIPGGRLLALGATTAHLAGGATAAGAAARLARGGETVGRLANAVRESDEVRVVVTTLERPARWSQATVTYARVDRVTGEVSTIDDIAESMARDGWKGDPVDVVQMPDGGLTSVDNRRLVAADLADIPVQAVVHQPTDAIDPSISWRFADRAGNAPDTWGGAVDNRIARQPAWWQDANRFGSSTRPRATGKP